jgi:hypothetical protein
VFFSVSVITLIGRYPSERSRDTHYSLAMREFSDFIFEEGLMDIPLVGYQFTWSNNRDDQCWSRIDRLLFSPNWEERFSDVVQRRLSRLLSDHFPLKLDCGVSNRSGGYFKFENMWLKSEGFVNQVKLWWQNYQFQGCLSYVLACKLKALKVDLRKWNEEIFGDVGNRKTVLLEGIQELDIIGEGRMLIKEARVRQDDFARELERLLLCEEVNWRQKSRAFWLREGDKNTVFSQGSEFK